MRVYTGHFTDIESDYVPCNQKFIDEDYYNEGRL